MADIEIKRGYEVLPDNNIRFGIRITNISDLAISDVEVILDYVDSLFKLEGDRLQKVGVIPPANTRTAEFVLKPLGCIHKVNIEATIFYRDSKWDKQIETMHPKEVHCVCPFLRSKAMPRAEFLKLSGSGHSAETGLNFKGVSVERLASYLVQTCKNRHHKVDDYLVDGGRMLYFASESIGEKAYYLLTTLIKEDDGLTQVMLRVASDKPHGLNGFLNETVAELRHVVGTVQSAQEIGIIKNEQVINIIDSVVERTSFGGVGGSAPVNIQDSVVQRTSFDGVGGSASVNIQDSVVQRTEFGTGEDRTAEREREKQRKEEEEQLELIKRKAQEEAEIKKKQEENLQNEQRRKQEEEQKTKTKLEQLEREQEAAHKEKEQQKTRQQEAPVQRPRAERQKPTQKSRKNVFMFAIVIGALLAGFAMFPPDSGDIADMLSQSYIQTSIVSQDSIQQTIDSLEFALIPDGEFDMGSPSNEAGRSDNEGPVHHVKISRAFYMSKYEITQKQWRDVMGTNPSYFKGDDLPVEQVSWNDVQDFIKKLNKNEGTDKYRLPSEAEWEYACRAGTTTRYSFGDGESLGEYAWYNDNLSSTTHPVGQKKPNSWGLYDMHGNVWEWVQDKYHGDYNGAPSDGSAWESIDSSYRVFRGGSWSYLARFCRSADRDGLGPQFPNRDTGFRLLQEP